MELWAFLKSKGLASTGGQAKILIRSGEVRLNGTVETRKKKKLGEGDVISVGGQDYAV